MNNEGELLNSYLGLWNNRTIPDGGTAPDEILHELMKREILDENAHPRVRKGKFEKFYLSVKRVVSSDLSGSDKAGLISVYVKVMEEL